MIETWEGVAAAGAPPLDALRAGFLDAGAGGDGGDSGDMDTIAGDLGDLHAWLPPAVALHLDTLMDGVDEREDVTAAGEPLHGDSINQYLKDIRDLPLLTPDEEIALARRIEEGDAEALQQF